MATGVMSLPEPVPPEGTEEGELRLILRIFAFIILFLVLSLLTGWGALALWYRLPGVEAVRGAVAGLLVLLALATLVAFFTRFRLWAIVAYVLAFAVLLVWWSTIKPPADGDWSPDVARQVTGTVDGDMLTLQNVRDFEWRSDTDFTERWETRTYDLSKLQSLDMFMSYWSGVRIAHVIVSFGFSDGQHIAWSIEVRRQRGGAFSPVADFFKTNPLVIVAADERDVVGVRSNVRGEDVQIYRLRTPPAGARLLLLEYVNDANALAAQPEFYNSITTNCTTTIVKMIRAVGDPIPLDWRLIVNGYLPDYAYDRGALYTRLPLSELRRLSHIDERARGAGLKSPDFSRLIRVGVPTPAQRPAQ